MSFADLFPRYAVRSVMPHKGESDAKLHAARTFADEVDAEMERLKIKPETRDAVRALYEGLQAAEAFKRK